MRRLWKDVSFETAAVLQLLIANGSSQALLEIRGKEYAADRH